MRFKFLFALLLLGFYAFSQDKSFNMILSIDGCLAPNKIESISLSYVDKQDKKQIVSGHYVPGELILKEEDYKKIMAENLSEIGLKVKTFEFTDEERTNYEFDVNLYADFFQNTYFILYIFNTDKECNGSMFRPLDGKNYTYEYQSSNPPSRTLVTKKNRDNSCFCN